MRIIIQQNRKNKTREKEEVATECVVATSFHTRLK